jgi:hypothetical protein
MADEMPYAEYYLLHRQMEALERIADALEALVVQTKPSANSDMENQRWRIRQSREGKP